VSLSSRISHQTIKWSLISRSWSNVIILSSESSSTNFLLRGQEDQLLATDSKFVRQWGSIDTLSRFTAYIKIRLKRFSTLKSLLTEYHLYRNQVVAARSYHKKDFVWHIPERTTHRKYTAITHTYALKGHLVQEVIEVAVKLISIEKICEYLFFLIDLYILETSDIPLALKKNLVNTLVCVSTQLDF